MSILPTSIPTESLAPAEDQRRIREWEAAVKSRLEESEDIREEWKYYRSLPKRLRRSWVQFCEHIVPMSPMRAIRATAPSNPVTSPPPPPLLPVYPRDLSCLRGQRAFGSIRRRARRLMFPTRCDKRMRHVPSYKPNVDIPSSTSTPFATAPSTPESAPVQLPSVALPLPVSPQPDLALLQRQTESLLCLIGLGFDFPLFILESDCTHFLDSIHRQTVCNAVSQLSQADRATLLTLHTVLCPDGLPSCKLRPHPVVASWIRGWFATTRDMLAWPLKGEEDIYLEE